ncbi:MAG: pilus assembly protein TadG-related protein [Acidimicrobiia bacterium]
MRSEKGAILPLIAIMLIMLLGFAALGVDASAAYSERTEAQSVADAAVLAAALEHLTTDSPTGQDLYGLVTSYTSLNWGTKAPTNADWIACQDTAKPADYIPIQDTSVNPPQPISDCISLKQVNGEPALLRVRLPAWDMPTAFAGVLGWDSLAISATATAELSYSESTKVLPFSVPANPSLEECLATPPSGLLPGDTVPCSGPSQGNFGILDTPWFGAGDPHYTTALGCPNNPNFNTMAPHNLAIGLDHLIQKWPTPPALPAVGANLPNNHANADSCASAAGGIIPSVLLTQPGNTQSAGGKALLQDGFIGDDPSPTPADLPGRLRQTSSPLASGDRLDIDAIGWDFDVDNVGLWEYLTNTGVSDPCLAENFNGPAATAVGRELTDLLLTCLTADPSTSTADFNEDLLLSPRFAIVPMLNYSSGQQYGNKWWAVMELVPVYLHSTWYDCTNGSDTECLFQPEDFMSDPADRDSYSVLFNPGEGTESPCYLNNGECVKPSASRFQLMGLSALVLDWDLLPDGAENQYGSTAPFEVFLHDNE